MYLCVLCCCDACLKSSALRVGVKTLYTMSTGSLILILVLFASKMQPWRFWYIGLLLLGESPLFGTILVK